MNKQEWQENNNALCCCEYFNNQEERSHLLACCCNCEDLDESVDRLVVCEQVPFHRFSGIMSTLQDRCRIPWRGGAKQISFDSALPIVIIPLLAYIASQNVVCTVIVFLSLIIGMCYIYRLFLKVLPRTKFFVVWSVTSLVLLLLVFEISVVPLLEILPEENLVLIGLVLSALWCTYKVRCKAVLNHVTHSDVPEATTELVCAVCRKRIPPRTYHCRICQACVIKRDHHCVWVDCCIGEKNHLLFFLAVLFSIGALAYDAILTLTSVCHPFFFMNVVLLPDDCSDVYHDSEIALCFVSALYCLFLTGFLIFMLFHQCWLISLGVTAQEWQSLQGLRSERQYSRGVFRNWASFMCSR